MVRLAVKLQSHTHQAAGGKMFSAHLVVQKCGFKVSRELWRHFNPSLIINNHVQKCMRAFFISFRKQQLLNQVIVALTSQSVSLKFDLVLDEMWGYLKATSTLVF